MHWWTRCSSLDNGTSETGSLADECDQWRRKQQKRLVSLKR